MQSNEPSDTLWNTLRRRKLVQWALAYLAGAWVLLQFLDIMAGIYDWPRVVLRVATAVLAIGFVAALVLAWYHGERGEQKATRIELLILAALFVAGGVLLSRIEHAAVSAAPVSNAANAAARPADPKSIAVLPFLNMSGDAKNDYFSDGITEEILNALAQVPDLKVAARTSAFAFKGKAEDLRKVGDVLGVATVLEGSVQTSGDEVRITAQLIDARSGFHIWSNTYDRKLTSIFAVEDEISTAIAGKLRTQLVGEKALVGNQTADPRAHDFYLRGLKLYAARGLGMLDAASAFEQATAIDPRYAQAWAELAQTEVQLHNWKLDADGKALARAQAAVDQALALDRNLASTQLALGMLHHARWEWSDAEEALHRAVLLAPGDAETIDQYAQLLLSAGQFEPALREIERANQLDPLSGVIGGTHAQILSALHRRNAASAKIAQTLAAAPDGIFPRGTAAMIAIDGKRYPEAEAQIRRLALLWGQDPDEFATTVQALTNPALRTKAIDFVNSKPRGYQGFQRIIWLTLLADRNTALTALEAAIAAGPIGGEERLWLPALDPIRNDPRFRKVMARIGIPYQPRYPVP